MKRVIAIAFVAIMTVALPMQIAAQKSSRELNALMSEKLTSAKLLLEGMALSDFDKIDKSATKLNQLTRTEEWFVLKTPRYEVFSNEFRRALDQIARKSKDKNIDGVALAYFDMTMACIRCHDYVREQRDARLETPKIEASGN